MHSVVCIKQVPDSSQIRIHPVTNTVMRQGVPSIVNPYDLFSLEAALCLRDQFGGKVTVITMGPQMATEALAKCLSHGADETILLSDRIFAGSDTLATSNALSYAIRNIEKTSPVDLVFCGKQSIDGDTGQVGPGLAWRLGLQQLTYVTKIEQIDAQAREITVHRRTEGGVQVIRTALPALITMLEGVNEIRFGSMEDAFRAAETDIECWNAGDIGPVDAATVGLKGSPTKVKKVFAPQPRTEKARMIEADGGTPRALADAILDVLIADYPTLLDDIKKSVAARWAEA
ncbi:acryloyl-CoA reductase electron transfer subunit gamma [bacterium BMS3Abin11]|nr:acryloyl-CoA reductase electron transfer subunit gamma [bacterium BMS3Abin11]GMT40488.1 MAG: electron transfer flavoprotein subunit beta [bacterium]